MFWKSRRGFPVLLIGVLSVLSLFTEWGKPGLPGPTILPAQKVQVLAATVQIRVYTPQNKPAEPGGLRPFILSKSLGSIANWGGMTVVVTHNHWGVLLEQAEFVRILDAGGRLALEMSGADYRAQLRCQDAGVVILEAPPALAARFAGHQAGIETGPVAAEGAQVVIVQQMDEQTDRVSLRLALITGRVAYKGVPTYRLSSLDDQPVLLGDSGGGVWLDGRLIGNFWGRAFENREEVGYAAPLQCQP